MEVSPPKKTKKYKIAVLKGLTKKAEKPKRVYLS